MSTTSATRLHSDPRTVMTLDAGGTNLRFVSVRAGQIVDEWLCMKSCVDNLNYCLAQIVSGFRQTAARCPEPPAAISFAFPGPADYRNGIIGDLANLPCFRGGVALKALLENEFRIPVLINNDGDLFTYGEALAGLLPKINHQLKSAGSQKQFRNLLGLTIGTGLGGGIVCNGVLLLGDNSAAGEIWLFPTRQHFDRFAEEEASIRAIRQKYAHYAGIPPDTAPEPDEIYRIATKTAPGNAVSAVESFRDLGRTLADVLCVALSLIDGLVVIGGGLSGAAALFLPTLVEQLNRQFVNSSGKMQRRLMQKAFNLEDLSQLQQFLHGDRQSITVPTIGPMADNAASGHCVSYDRMSRTGIGLSQLGTGQAVALGAYAVAIQHLDNES